MDWQYLLVGCVGIITLVVIVRWMFLLVNHHSNGKMGCVGCSSCDKKRNLQSAKGVEILENSKEIKEKRNFG